MDREDAIATLKARFMDGMLGGVATVLESLSDENLDALLRATNGDDPVSQALAERFVFRRAAALAMERASSAAKKRSASRRETPLSTEDAPDLEETLGLKPQEPQEPQDDDPARWIPPWRKY